MAESIDTEFEENVADNDIKLPENSVVSDLLKKRQVLEQKNAEERGNYKAEVDSAKDKGVNAKAFKIFASIMKIEAQTDRDELMRHLVHYYNELGQDDQQDLFGDAPMGHNSQAVNEPVPALA